MKTSITVSLILSAIIILIGVTSASAQGGKALVANVPFDFYVKNRLFPAGRYEFGPATSNYQIAPLIVRSTDGSRSVVAISGSEYMGIVGKTEPFIRFNQYGGVYYLSAVSQPGGMGLQLAKSRDERELARNFTNLSPETTKTRSTTRTITARLASREVNK